jgi:hypothetical protein
MKRTVYPLIALISLTLIALELVWTRMLSAELFYTFAFLVLSLAILGLGLGGLAVRLFARLGRSEMIGRYLSLAAVCTVFGPTLVFMMAPDFTSLFTSWLTVGKLVLTVFILMSAYFFGGMALSILFRQNPQDMPRLYMADMLGAGLGVLAAVWGMNVFGTPQASFLVALPILVASFLTMHRWEKSFPVVLAAIALGLSPHATTWLTLPREERAPVIFTHWDAMSKIKLYEYAPDSRGLNIDNVANTPVYRFDGNWSALDPDSADWGIDVSYLVRKFHPCTFLSLGSGGGADVFQALAEGATEVHAVEINRYINRMMLVADTTGYVRQAPQTADSSDPATDSSAIAALRAPLQSVAEFSGYLYRDPRVTVVTEDARAYVRRFNGKFDVIYSLSSNTWAALASGAFALAENYLFTTEAYRDYWRALTDSGFMMMEHQMYVPRLVTEVMEALTSMGVADPTRHFAVYDLPQMRRRIILLSKRPLTDELRNHALGALTPEKFDRIHLLYPPVNDSVAQDIVPRIVAKGWRLVADSTPVDISPVTDDRPYVAQMGLWRNFTADKRAHMTRYAEFSGFPISRVVMMIVLVVVALIVLPVNLLPYLRRGAHLQPVPWLYFFCIGAAFMAVEVVLIQKYALLVGSSLYSITTVLLTLLLASGIGSRFANVVSDRSVFIAIIGWLLLDALASRHLIDVAGTWDLVPRMALTAAWVSPLGFFMGMPFPKGTLRVGALIDWGFAVNGAASVLGSVLVLLAAFAWGFSVALMLAAGVYLAAFVLFSCRAAWPQPVALEGPEAGLSTEVLDREQA